MINLFSFFSVSLFCYSYMFPFFLSMNFSLKNELTVLSYNIRYDNPNDGENQWKYRKERVANYIKEIRPDIIGMQEVLDPQLVFLDVSLTEFSYVGVGREDGKTKGEYSPILYNSNRLTLLQTDTFWLSETPKVISVGWDAALERICTYAQFKHKETGQKFWVFNTHFDHIGELARIQSAKLIHQKIKMLNTNNFPVIITGDFNLTPDTAPIKIFQNAYVDVMQKTPTNANNYGTFTGFDKLSNGKERIDYIFQKGLKTLKSTHIWLKTTSGGWASDHHPVQAIFSFNY
jgi:endonuclease/exonuclease/phosphatase family metal-dependent hydrolase